MRVNVKAMSTWMKRVERDLTLGSKRTMQYADDML